MSDFSLSASSTEETTSISLIPEPCLGMGAVMMLGFSGGSNSITLLSIKSWILVFRAQQSLVSCPGLLEWYAHHAFGLYFGDDVLGFWGGSHSVINCAFNRCCNAWVNGILILVNCLLGGSDLCWFPSCYGRASVGLEINMTPTDWWRSFLLQLLWP